MCEISLVKFRYASDQQAAIHDVKQIAGIARLMEHGDQVARVVRFGKVICLAIVILVWVPQGTDWISYHLLPAGDYSAGLYFLTFMLAIMVYFYFAEIVPRGIAMRNAHVALLRSYRVFNLFYGLSWPCMLIFRGLKKLFYARIGVAHQDELNPLDFDVQIRAIGEETHELSGGIRRIVNRAIQMQELVVHDVLLPRNQVVVYDLDQSYEKNLERMQVAGHTRFPLCYGSLDQCIGIIHIKDIFRLTDTARLAQPVKLKRMIAQFTLETSLEEALERMLRAKFHMALVEDTFGGIVGVVTLESILEKLVGDIQDEFDSEEVQIEELSTRNQYKISGLTPLHEIEAKLEIEIDNDEVSTFGGLITLELGKLPRNGQKLRLHGLQVTINEVDERRVISTTVSRFVDS
jgi:CBS domain containing-hemolysin-like protein